MNSDNKDPDQTRNGDAPLEAMLAAWHVPPPSPWLARRSVQGIVAGMERSVWPIPPLRLAAVAGMAAVVGLVLGLAVPAVDDANAASESEAMIEMMW